VFRGKSQAYCLKEDKVAYALFYMTGVAPNWAMPILQVLDEGCHYNSLISYDGFREVVIGVFIDINRRSNAEDQLERLLQTGLVATYISMFNEYATQLD